MDLVELKLAQTRFEEELKKSIDVELELATFESIEMEWAQQSNMEYKDEVIKIEKSLELEHYTNLFESIEMDWEMGGGMEYYMECQNDPKRYGYGIL
jgi:hypothetical protein